MNLLLLGAGLGTRLKPITHKIPKPALPILNIPMLLWNYFYFKDFFYKNILVNTYHLEETLRDKISPYNSHFIFSSDGKEVLGTGGAISNNKDILITDEHFWVVNGDGFFLADAPFVEATEERHLKTQALCTLVVCEHPDVGTKFGGVWVDAKGVVLSIGKKRPAAAVKGYHFTGFRILSKDIFTTLPARGAHELFDTLNACIENGARVEIQQVDGAFFETGNEADYLHTHQQALEFLKAKKYSAVLHAALKAYSPESRLNAPEFLLKLQPQENPKDLFCDERFRIFEGTQMQGFVVTGKNVTTRENCIFKNVVILDNMDIPPNSQFQNCIIY